MVDRDAVRASVPVNPASEAAAAVLRALRQPELLQAVVQPIVNLHDGSVAGWEVLTRASDALGLTPSELFGAAQAMGVAADLHVVALRASLDLLRTLPPTTFLTVNVDPIAMVSGQVQQVLRGTDDLSGLIIEMVESAWPADPTALLDTLDELRLHGARFAVDDVGAGYSGLSQLMAVRPDLVKLDKSLIQNLPNDPAAGALVTAVGMLSGTLDAWVAVEGIETPGQLDAVTRLGVPLAQGYLFGRPQAPWPEVAEIGLAALADTGRPPRTGQVAELGRPPRPGEVLLDTHGRPTGVVDRTGDLSVEHPAMTLAPSTRTNHALRRAMERPARDRFSPLVVTSPTGHVVSLLDIDTMVLAVSSDDAFPTGPITL